MNQIPKFEPLEDRIVLDGEAEVTVSGPTNIQLGQQDVEFTLTFDNVSPTDTGYAPFVDVIIPTLGADGDDGATFDGATFLGSSVNTFEIVFDAAGEAEHPLAVDNLGNPLIVSGTPGETLVVFELPYGSFSSGNPPVDIVMTLDFSDQADLDEPFTLQTRGGFALGNDALDNPTTDPSLVGTFQSSTVDQDLFQLGKSNNAPENEAATGPSYPYTYTLSVDVAPGQTLTDFNLVDTLPPEIVYLGGLTISPSGGTTVNDEPTIGALAGPGNNTIDIDFASISGSVTVQFDYYINDVAAGATSETIDPATGDAATVQNSVTGSGTWDPLDADDPVEVVSATATDTLSASSLAVQKSATVVEDNGIVGTPTPGDVYLFTLEVQISDYFTFGDLEITDILGNGWEYVNDPGLGRVPEFSTTESSGGSITGGSLAGTESVSLNAATGETTLVWNLSDAMIAAGSDGLLTGDDADGSAGGASTTATITYYARILDEFTDDAGVGQVDISQGDVLSNDATISATVRDNSDPSVVLGTEENSSSSGVTLPFGQIDSKTIAFVNGAAPDPTVPVAAGDEITFSVVYTAPIGAFEDLSITDNLPQDIFDASEITTFNAVSNAGPPAAGQAQFGPTDTFLSEGGGVPSIGVVPNDNQLTFDFGDFTADPLDVVTIEILFTVTVQDALFADGLFLTNQATAQESNTFSSVTDSTAIAQFDYSEPVLDITKGVIASDNPNASFSAATGPVAFTPPESTGPRFGGTVTSDGLETTPIDANITGVDAGDVVTFAIVVENTGSAPNGAFNVTIEDTIPDGFSIPTTASGLNLSVTDGTGARDITFVGDLFAGGIVLDDRGIEGALSSYDPTAGDNLVIITYDLVVDQDVTASQTIENTATLTNYNAFEGGGGVTPIDRTPVDLTDDATATTEDVEIEKTLTDTEFDEQGASQVLVGEEFTFTIRVDLPEGTYDNAVITDTVRSTGSFGDYEMLSAEVVTWDTTDLTSSTGITLGSAGTVAADGNSVTFDLGTLVNAGTNDTTDDFIEIEVTARSLGSQSEGAGDRLGNQASFTADGITERDNGAVRVIEPQLGIDKTATPSVVMAGDTVSYQVVIDNPVQPFDAPAFDLVFEDFLDPNVTLDVGSVNVVGGDGVTILAGNTAGDTSISLTADRLGVNQQIVVTYTATVIPTVEAGQVIDNTASITFDSLPTDDADDERDYFLSDDAQVSAADADITKEVIATSNDDTTGTNLAIGEEVTYEITVVLPEGTNTDAVITDLLPSTFGTLDYVTSEVIAIGSDITGSALSVGDAGVESGGVVTFNFGTLTNANNNTINDGDEIVVRVTGILTDLAVNEDGDVLANTGQFATSQTSVSDTAEITVVEPDLDIDKTADVTEADAGDTVTFTVTSTNDGTGPAYDIVIDDALGDAGLEVPTPAVASIRIEDAGGADVTPVGADAPVVTYPTGTGGLQAVIPELLPGQTIIIEYETVVTDALLMGDQLENTATVARYDSDPAGDTTDPDDGRVYTGPSATETVSAPDPTITKEVVGTDDPNTTGTDVGISETITYEIEITLPEGTSDILVFDELPAGLVPISAEITSMDAGITANLAQGDTDASSFISVGAGGGYTFDFGTVVNPGDNIAANNVITITVEAQVADVAAAADGATLTNTANLVLIDPLTGDPRANPDTGNPLIFTDTADVDVLEPELNIDKSVSPTAADAGDTLSYTIVSENTGSGPAYDILIEDPISDATLEIPSPAVGTIRIEDAGGADVTPVGADAPTLVYPTGAGGLEATIPVLLPGQSIVIEFEAVLADAATFSSSFANTAQVTEFGTDPDGDAGDADDGRVYDASRPGYTVPTDSATVASPDLTLDKTIVSTSETGTSGTDVTIGEEITYLMTITLPEGTGDLVLVDDLPDGLTALSARIVSLGDGTNITTDNLAAGDTDASGFITLGADVTFDFGTVTVDATDDGAATDETIVVEVTARVDDVAGNVEGTDLLNTAELTITDPDTGAELQPPVTDTAEVEVLEPALDIEKTGPIAANPGDTIPYTVTVTNTGRAPAHDIVFSDTLGDPDLTFTGTPVFAIDGVPFTPTVTPTSGGFSAVIGTLEPGETLTVTYEAVLSATAPEAESFPNTATVIYDTIDDGDPATPDGRDYSNSDDFQVATVPSISKEATGSSLTQTGDGEFDSNDLDLVVGEEVTYTLTLVLPEVDMDSVIVMDTLPAGLEFVSAAFVSEGAQITGAADVVISNLGQVTTFDFGAMDHVGDGVIDTGDQVIIEVTARVTDVAAVTDGASLENTATLDVIADGGIALNQATDTATVDIVEPVLEIDKTGAVAADPGDTIAYQIEIENTGTGPAFDIEVADAFADANLSLVSGTVSATIDGTPITITVNETGTGFDFITPELLPGEVLVVSYSGLLDAGAPAGESYINTATATFDTVPDGDPDSPDGRSDGVSDDHAVGAGPLLDKTVISSSNADTGSDQFGAAPDLVVGEEVTFALTVTFSEIAMDSAVLVDTLPDGLSFVSAVVDSVGTGIIGADTPAISNLGQTVTIDFGSVTNPFDGSLGADDEVVVLITALVTDDVDNTDGTVLTNTSSLTVTPAGEAPLATVTDTADVEIVEPELGLTKEGPVAVNPGDTADYAVTIENTGSGPAYDLQVVDAFGDPFLAFNSGSLTASITPAGGGAATDITASLTVVATATGFEVLIPALQVGEVLEIGYSATLDAAAPDAQTFLNTASVTFDTVEDGDPNSPTGRTDSVDDGHGVATVPFIEKTPIATDFGATGSGEGDPALFDLTVGETVTFEYVVYLPEIGMDSVILTDALDPELEFLGVTVTSVGSGITLGNPTPVVTATDAQNYTIDLGAVTNASDGTIGADDIVILQVQARVIDVPTAQSGTVVNNTVSVTVDPAGPDGPLTPASDTGQIEIVAPDVSLDKTGPLAVNPGDTATYTLTMENTGDGPAYDLAIADTLGDANLSLVSGSVVLAIDGTPITPTVTETGTGFDVLVPTLLPGEVLTVTYDATLSATAPAAESFTNTATLGYDTVPDGDPDSPTGRSDDLTDDHTVATIPGIDKSVVYTSDIGTGSGQGDPAVPDLGIGEEVTYEIVLTLPEINLDSIVVTDTLPDGLTLASVNVISVGDDIVLAGSEVISVLGQTTTIDLGAATSLGDGTIDGDDEIVIEVVAVVADVAAATDGALLTNTSTLSITPEGEAPLATQEDTASIEVVEPALTIEKDGTIAADPGDTVSYSLTVTNTGTGPAYDIEVQDLLGDPNLSLVGVTTATIDGSDILGLITITPTGSGFETLVGALLPGETLVITYDVLLDGAAPNAESFDNTATIDFDTIPDANPDTPGARDGTDSDDHSVATVPFLFKTAIGSDQTETGSAEGAADALDLSIGETVFYSFEIYLPEIALDSVVMVDTLPDGFSFVSAAVSDVGSNLTGAGTPIISVSGQDVTFDFGAVTNAANGSIGVDDRITVEVVALVEDDALNVDGATRTNEARLNVDPNGAPAFDEVVATEDVDIVEPDIGLEKTGPLAVNPGATASYTITAENTGTGPAFDLAISDALADANLSLNSGTVVVAIDGVPQAVTVTETGTGFDLLVPTLLPGEVLTVTYDATLSASVPAATTTFNTAEIAFDTVPDGDPNSATGRGGSDSDDHGVATIPTLDKSVIGTANADTGAGAHDPAIEDVTIGEEITYELILTLPEIAMDSVVLADTLPPGMTFVSATVTSVGTGITASAPTITTLGQVTTFDFGAVINAFDGSIGADDEIRIEVVSVVTDDPAAFDGVQLTNTGALTVTPQGEGPLATQTDTATIEVVEPDLVIDKTVSDSQPLVGDTITYTVVLTNDPAATAPIYNAVVTDALPFQLELTGDIILSDGSLATVTAGTTAGETTLVVSVPRLLPGESVTITYDVFVGFATDVLTGVTNIANVEGTSTPDVTNPFNRVSDTSDDAVIIADPIPVEEAEDGRLPGLGIDDALFLPILSIDPIYSGSAEPGANVTISLYRQDGALTQVRNIVADAGGHWIAIFPRVELQSPFEDFWSWYNGSRVFDAPIRPVDSIAVDDLATGADIRQSVVGNRLNTDSYYVELNTDRASTLPQDRGMFNARTYYASAITQEAFVTQNTLKVDEVFEALAGLTVERLYAASENPLGEGLNRFNYEFLSGATATPGSAQ